MFIHKSHSKKDLINIIKTFKIDIDEPNAYRKRDLVTRLKKELSLIDSIEPELDVYLFNNKIDLLEYLRNCNPKKVLSIKEKNNVILTCKRLQHYIKNNYNIDSSTYSDIDEVIDDAKYIEPYGSIPSVRRACKGLNDEPSKIFKLNPFIDKLTEREIAKRLAYKNINHMKLKVHYGSFHLTFD